MRTLLMWGLLMISTVAQAQEIEIFLKQGMEIIGTEQAHKAGYSITYYYLDATQTIEQELSATFTGSLKQQLENAETGSDITQQIIDQFNNRNNPETAKQLHALITEDIKVKLAKAWRDVIYAKGLKILPQDLPVIRMDSVNHTNASDLSTLVEESK